jgi:hypothetical protein
VKRYTFDVSKQKPPEACAQPGKPEWRDMVMLRLTQKQALALAHQLIGCALAYPDDVTEYPILGELTEAQKGRE